MGINATYELRKPHKDEFDAWYALYEPYSHDVESPVNPDIGRSMWEWIHDPHHAVDAVVAVREGRLVGFTHYRPFPRTLDGNEACFLDDLYVAPSERGSALAKKLIENLVRIARESGWTHVRWVTTQGNARARKLYDRVAEQMDLITYKIESEHKLG
ncbi:MAG: GNAT family N-acetyltransferase [Vulcanimicrobiaceae bacterium]